MKGLKEKPIREYGSWEINPEVVKISIAKPLIHPEMISKDTMYEGPITYYQFWNYWVRVGTPADTRAEIFFKNYESGSSVVWNLINAIGAPTAWPRSEEEVWGRISTVWNWLGENVRLDHQAYHDIIVTSGGWPSIDDLSQYYSEHGELVWSACFSVAHTFATLLGRVLPRWRIIIAEAHHTENGAPPTATHVYVGVYLSDRWFYLDPTAVYAGPLDNFKNKKSRGIFSKVDYEHPYHAIPVPLSPFDKVPFLPK